MPRLSPAVLFALLLLLPACGLLRGPSPDEEPAPPPPAEEPRSEPPTAEPPPPRRTPPPERTEPPKPPAPVTRTVQGFRVQILTTDDKNAADARVGDASRWYAGLGASDRPAYLGEGGLTVEIDWRAPYYRVRLGAFATRAEAERALRAVARKYPDAFIVPDTVTVTR